MGNETSIPVSGSPNRKSGAPMPVSSSDSNDSDKNKDAPNVNVSLNSSSDLIHSFILAACGTPCSTNDETDYVVKKAKQKMEDSGFVASNAIAKNGNVQKEPATPRSHSPHPSRELMQHYEHQRAEPVKSSKKKQSKPVEDTKKRSTNELHELVKERDWLSLRDRLTMTTPDGVTPAHVLASEFDEKGRTPLMLACMTGTRFPADVARLLIVAYPKAASLPIQSTKPDTSKKGNSYCLHAAAISGVCIESLSILLGAYPQAARTPDANGNMPLHLLVNMGKYRTVKSADNDDDTVDTMGTTLTYATGVDSLISRGGGAPSSVGGADNMDNLDAGPTANAVDSALWQVCDFLISAYPQALLHRNERGETPLMLAMYRRAPTDALSLLMKRGGVESVRIADDFGSYPLHFCDRTTSTQIIKEMAHLYPEAILLRNKLGDTPLYSAMGEECEVEMVRVLLEECLNPSDAVRNKNKEDKNVIRLSWENLTIKKIVAAEDEDGENARIQSNKETIATSMSTHDISLSDVGMWWEKATLLLQAAYHNTVSMSSDGMIGKEKKKIWRPIHAAAGTECPFDLVAFVLRIYNTESPNVDEDGDAPIHVAVTRPQTVPTKTVELLWNSYPAHAVRQNRNGCTPLHLACLHKANLDTIQLLVDANSEACVMTNNLGQTPLMIALAVGCSIEHIRVLLKSRPEAVKIRDSQGNSSIAVAWNMMLLGKQSDSNNGIVAFNGADRVAEERRGKENRLALAMATKSSGLTGEVRLWMGIVDMLLRSSFHGSAEDPLPRNIQWRAVHASCAGGICPPELLAFALQILPREVSVINEEGNLPLHLVAAGEPHVANCPKQLWSGDSIGMVLKLNRSGAMKSDRRGRLPLHIALSSQKTWNHGVKSLVEAFPEAVRMRDPHTGLFPFMLAASVALKESSSSEEASDVRQRSVDTETANTIFMLLLAAPELVGTTFGNAEKMFLWRSRKELTGELHDAKAQLKTAEGELHKRMTPDELMELADKKRLAEAETKENERRDRAETLANSSGQFRTSLATIEDSTYKLRA